MIPLRRFNHASIEAFEDTLDRIGAGEEIDVAALSLAEPTHTDRLSPSPAWLDVLAPKDASGYRKVGCAGAVDSCG